MSVVKYALIQMEATYMTAILDMYFFLMAGHAVKIQVNAEVLSLSIHTTFNLLTNWRKYQYTLML